MTELLKQPQFSPMPVEDQVVSLYAGTQGFLDDIPTQDVRRFELELLQSINARAPEVMEHLRSKGDFPEEIESKLKGAITEFRAGFRASEAAPAASTEALRVADTEDAVSGDSYTT